MGISPQSPLPTGLGSVRLWCHLVSGQLNRAGLALMVMCTMVSLWTTVGWLPSGQGHHRESPTGHTFGQIMQEMLCPAHPRGVEEQAFQNAVAMVLVAGCYRPSRIKTFLTTFLSIDRFWDVCTNPGTSTVKEREMVPLYVRSNVCNADLGSVKWLDGIDGAMMHR